MIPEILADAGALGEPDGVLLLIEDDDVDAERITRWIAATDHLPWRVVRARTLAEAEVEIARQQPVVAVADLTLPDAHGLEVVGRLVELVPGAPIVVQTGVDDRHTPAVALRLGAQDYLTKDSLTKEALGRAVVNAVTRHSLRETQEMLKESVSELDDFAHVVAHDLRAPVRTARLLADRLLARLDDLDDFSADLGSRLDEALGRVDGMILSMLDYAALRGAPPTLEDVPIREHAMAAAAAVEADLDAMGGSIEVVMDHDLTAVANANLLDRVLINLLTNAIRYRQPDVPPAITVRGERVEACVRLQVIDNGLGIPPADRERVFGLLERLDHRGAGLGFGLAICRRAVESCGGSIWVESSRGPGTTVTIELEPAASS